MPDTAAPVPRAASLRPNVEAATALLLTALGLTLIEYLGVRPAFGGGASSRSLPALSSWAGICVVFYAAVPYAVARFAFGRRPVELGFRLQGLARHLPLYGLLLLAVAPLVWFASRRGDFLAIYPFLRAANRTTSALLMWELLYAAQFVALEAFFRGYLLFTLERSIGATAAFVSAVPYAMIHFHKPLPEALGATVAGIVLGLAALRCRSFLGGAALHIAVAVGMDVLALSRGPATGP